MASSISVRLRSWAVVCLVFAGLGGGLGAAEAAGPLGSEAARAWAHAQAQRWSIYHVDARGNRHWDNKRFSELSWSDQTAQLIERLNDRWEGGWPAVILLMEHPPQEWAEAALAKAGPRRDELAHLLYLKGWKQPGKDPYAYLPQATLARPWTQGWGLHLEPGGGWRFQWIPSPALLTPATGDPLPKALAQAPQPSALLHLRQLRPGLQRLKQLATEGVTGALTQGTRGGFLFKHLDRWLAEASPALEPLAGREAWVLHYGLKRGEGPGEGTLVFLPGELPTRTQLLLGLLKLNPLAKGARNRTATWTIPGASMQVQQVRGSGGVLNLFTTQAGTWVCDREAPLRAMFLERRSFTLGERPEWCRTALAGMGTATEVSLWVAPRNGAGAAFEGAMIRRRLTRATQPTWPNPFIAKAAPRTGVLALGLGAGPTESLVASFLRVDDEAPIADPTMPDFANDGVNLTAEQKRDFLAEKEAARVRRDQRAALRKDLDPLLGMLDLRGAALLWNGWVAPPPLTESEKAAQAELRRLKSEAPQQAAAMQREGRAGLYGGFGEPGLAPSLALALPVKAGRAKDLEALLERRFPGLFRGQAQKRAQGGVELHRVRTTQAFAPCWTVVADTLVLGSDDGAVAAVAAGLQGQAPTLADLPSQAFGRAEVDGPKVARELENLLLAYLRTQRGRPWWWGGEAPPEADESAAEVAETFGPFLGALRGLGKVRLDLTLTAGGFEARVP